MKLRGSVQGMRASFRSFGVGLILSVVLVYLILVAQFASWTDPFIILLAVPPGLAGVLLFLLVTNTTLNVMSLMGVVMMVGIVVSNSILIVEFARHLQKEGKRVKEAVAIASRQRLRPVLMTSLATLLGLIPMALGIEAGSEAYAPLAQSDYRRTAGVRRGDCLPRACGVSAGASQRRSGGGAGLKQRLFMLVMLLGVCTGIAAGASSAGADSRKPWAHPQHSGGKPLTLQEAEAIAHAKTIRRSPWEGCRHCKPVNSCARFARLCCRRWV